MLGVITGRAEEGGGCDGGGRKGEEVMHTGGAENEVGGSGEVIDGRR